MSPARESCATIRLLQTSGTTAAGGEASTVDTAETDADPVRCPDCQR